MPTEQGGVADGGTYSNKNKRLTLQYCMVLQYPRQIMPGWAQQQHCAGTTTCVSVREIDGIAAIPLYIDDSYQAIGHNTISVRGPSRN